MNPIRTTLFKQGDSTGHVQPLVLWQCACGERDLAKRDYHHIIACPECETLASEIGEALGDLERVLGRRQRRGAAS